MRAPKDDWAPRRVLADGEAMGIATQCARRISTWAVRKGEAAAWIGLTSGGDDEPGQLRVLGFDLYDGAPGIALFLSAHAFLTSDNESHALALAALSGLRHVLLSSGSARLARGVGLGAATGLGSIVYALTLSSTLLQDSSLLADAHVAATLVTDDVIAADAAFDVIGGSAGAILGLLKLYRVTQDSFALERATRCGEHLLSHRPQNAPRLWRRPNMRALTGFSHGAAGFAYALSCLSAATGRDDFGRVGRECLAYERSTYSVERDNWPDFHSLDARGEASWPCRWCHGAGGIGLSRLGIRLFGAEADGQDGPEIEVAIRRVLQSFPSAIDSMCCGNLGNLELLREAARVLDRPQLRDEAARGLASVADAAAHSGNFRFGVGQDRYNLGLFRGIAGVGYAMLRDVDSGHLPNVLIWE